MTLNDHLPPDRYEILRGYGRSRAVLDVTSELAGGNRMTALSRLAASRRFEHAVRAVPTAERLAWRAASRYFAGETPASAIGVARDLRDRGVGSSLDLFGEEVEDTLAADRVTADYLELADQVNGMPAEVWLSVDPSHLGLRADPAGCADRLAAIAAHLPPTSAGLRATRTGWRHSASTSAWSRAPTRDRPIWRCPSGNPPASPTSGSHTSSPGPARSSLPGHPRWRAARGARGIPVRLYVPFGPGWFRYWMRRAAESRRTIR